MIMNLFQNFSTTDLTIIGLGLTLFNYSLYCLYTQSIPLGYKTIYFNDNISDINSIDTESLRSLNTTESSSSTEKVYFSTEELNSSVEEVNSNITTLVDASVQTDQKMLYNYMNELIYNNATPVTSLGEISPTDFVREYRNDPALASYFEKTADWADSISRQTSGTSANSEIIFMRKIGEEINNIRDLISNNLSSVNVNSNPISPVVEHPVSKILEQNSLLYPSYDGWLNEIFNKIINLQDKITDIEQLRKLIDLYSIIPNEIYNVDYVSTLIIYGSI